MKQPCTPAHPVPCPPYLFILISTLFWASCNPTDDPSVNTEQYPILFKYQTLAFQPSRFYVLTATSSNEIPPSGTYKVIDSYLQDELDINDWSFEIEKVELLDETRVRVYFFPALSIVPSDTVVTYTQVGQEIQFDFGGTQVEPYRYIWDKVNKTLSVCLQTVQSAHFDTVSGKVDYSSFHLRNVCDDGNSAAMIETQRTKWNLLPGDTVLLNYSKWQYPAQ